MGRRAQRNLLPALVALLGLCWGQTAARGQYSYDGPRNSNYAPNGYTPGSQGASYPGTALPGANFNGYPVPLGSSAGYPAAPTSNPGAYLMSAAPGNAHGPVNQGLPQNIYQQSADMDPAVPGNGQAPEPRMVPLPTKDGDIIMDHGSPGPGPCPRELTPTSLPPYTIAPPDILFLDAIRLIPKPPYRIEPLELVLLDVTDTLPGQPIKGQFVVSPEGFINLGYSYGSVRIGGLTLEQAQTAIRTHLSQILRNPQVTLALAQFRGLQQLRGQHLIRPDGTISLGTYGSVYVAGLTLGQAKCVLEKYLSNYILDPQIAVDVLAYNSKVYYVIFDGGGFGQQVFRVPVTGNEYVLDAIGMVQGLAPVSSKKRIWLARPSPAHMGCNQILPVDWNAITMGGSTATNYQVFPGDRIYVSANRLIAFDNYLSMVIAPIERVLGLTLLGTYTGLGIRAFRNNNNNGNTGFVPIIGR